MLLSDSSQIRVATSLHLHFHKYSMFIFYLSIIIHIEGTIWVRNSNQTSKPEFVTKIVIVDDNSVPELSSPNFVKNFDSFIVNLTDTLQHSLIIK